MRRLKIMLVSPDFDGPITDEQAIWTVDTGPLAGRRIRLLTPAQFAELPDGTELCSIAGRIVHKGFDHIDQDRRGGRLAYGQVLEQLDLWGDR